MATHRVIANWGLILRMACLLARAEDLTPLAQSGQMRIVLCIKRQFSNKLLNIEEAACTAAFFFYEWFKDETKSLRLQEL